jgi:DNA mismatch repair protein MutS
MYDEYLEHFKNYSSLYGSQTAIFFQVGKFYEFYDILDSLTGEGQTTTKQITDLLGIKLTYKKATGLPAGRDGLWAGVPTQSLHNFAMRLTSQGWTCVIIDESKDEKGKITRATSRILSPGTHLETADGTESMFLATLWLEEVPWSPPRFGASVVDLTTGESVSYEGCAVGREDAWAADDLLQFFQVHPPRECLVLWQGDVMSMPSEKFLRSRLGLPAALHIKMAASLEPNQREDILGRIFKPKTLLPLRNYLHLAHTGRAELALVALVRTVEEHFPSLTDRLHAHRIWLPEESVFLGNNVLTQINFIGAREDESVLGLFMNTHTLMGRRAMRRRLLYCIRDVSVLNRRLDDLDALYEMRKEDRNALHSLLQRMSDLARLHRKIQTYTLTAADVLLLEQGYVYTVRLAEATQHTPLAFPPDMLTALRNYIEVFKEHVDLEKAARVDEDTFFLPAAKAPQTAVIEEQLAVIKRRVDEIVETLRTWAGLAEGALRIESRDSLLYCITGTKTTIRALAQKLKTAEAPFPGITVTEKKSGANVNVPHLELIHNEVVKKRAALQEAFNRELPPLCQALVDTYLETWHTIHSWVAELDVNVTLQRVCEACGFTRPRIEEGPVGSIDIRGLRHPLIEAQQTRVEYVKHDVNLSGHGWLLYGMNASGKSSLMKSIGIATVLAQTGCYVPAVSMRLTPYSSIFTRILNHDNLWAGLSSFAVEMTELREILLKADERSLILGDEVCSGTESVSATSLVASALSWLSKRRSSFLFATHLHGLLSVGAVAACKGLETWHLRVRYEPATGVLVYDRTLQRGAGSSMYGLEVARALNLPVDFLEVAQKARHELLGSVTDEEAPASAWNPVIQRKSCEVCGSSFVADIEIHHIRPRAEAVAGLFSDGTHQNHMRNLIAVCAGCHDKHHAKELIIGPVRQTSGGQVRELRFAETPKLKCKWAIQQQETILKMLREKPKVAISRILFELEEYYAIKISAATLQKIRKTGSFPC